MTLIQYPPPVLQQELDVYRVNPYGTSVGHQNHISQTHSSCGPHDSPSQTIEVVKQLLRDGEWAGVE